MDDSKRITILRHALDTILFEAKEPIIRVYAQSALDETKEAEAAKQTAIDSVYCKKHNWYGTLEEKCPMCKQLLKPNKQ